MAWSCWRASADLLPLCLRAELLELDAVGCANLLRAGQRPQLLGDAAQEEVDGSVHPFAIDALRQDRLKVVDHSLPLLAEPRAGPADQLDQRILYHLGLQEQFVSLDGGNQVLILGRVLLDEASHAGLQGAVNRLEQIAARGEPADLARDLVAAQTLCAAGQ